jgi:hypothetical protein
MSELGQRTDSKDWQQDVIDRANHRGIISHEDGARSEQHALSAPSRFAALGTTLVAGERLLGLFEALVDFVPILLGHLEGG